MQQRSRGSVANGMYAAGDDSSVVKRTVCSWRVRQGGKRNVYQEWLAWHGSKRTMFVEVMAMQPWQVLLGLQAGQLHFEGLVQHNKLTSGH